MNENPPSVEWRIGFGLRVALLACAILLVLAITAIEPGGMLAAILFGWVKFLSRIRDEMKPDAAALAVIGFCASTLLIGFHLFARWLSGAIRENRADAAPAKPWRLRWSATIVGLVLALFLAGIAAIGVVHQTLWLSSSPEPIFQPIRNRNHVKVFLR